MNTITRRDPRITELARLLADCLRPGVLTESESARADRIRARIVDHATNPLPTAITIKEERTARVYAATAHNDHDVTLQPGTYELDWSRRDWVTAAIPAIEQPWYETTASFGGVAYAGQERGGDQVTYHLSLREYQVRGKREFNGYQLHI